MIRDDFYTLMHKILTAHQPNYKNLEIQFRASLAYVFRVSLAQEASGAVCGGGGGGGGGARPIGFVAAFSQAFLLSGWPGFIGIGLSLRAKW